MAKSSFKLKGMDKFMKNMNKEITDLRGRTLEGLIDAIIILQREAEPGTPVDMGNLRSSWFSVTYKGDSITIGRFKGDNAAQLQKNHSTVISRAEMAAKALGSDKKPIVMFGYTANYAVFVHENVDAKFKRPSARARWLFTALMNSRKDMLEAIRKKAEF